MVGWRSMPSLKVSTTFRCSCVKGSARRICRARRGAPAAARTLQLTVRGRARASLRRRSAKQPGGSGLQNSLPQRQAQILRVRSLGDAQALRVVLEQPVVSASARARPKYPGRELGASPSFEILHVCHAPKRASLATFSRARDKRADSAADKTRYPRAVRPPEAARGDYTTQADVSGTSLVCYERWCNARASSPSLRRAKTILLGERSPSLTSKRMLRLRPAIRAFATKKLNLNADLGEGFGPWRLTDDAALMELVHERERRVRRPRRRRGDHGSCVRPGGGSGCEYRCAPGLRRQAGFWEARHSPSMDEVEELVVCQVGALRTEAASLKVGVASNSVTQAARRSSRARGATSM